MTHGFRRIGDILPKDYREQIDREYQRRQKIRAKRIAQYGWDENSECDECGDTGTNVLTKALCWCPVGEHKSNQRRLAAEWPLVIPAKFSEARLQSHPNRDATEEVRFWLQDGYPEGRNLLLTGGIGTGKTGLAIGVMREVFMLGKRVLFDTMPSYLRRLRPAAEGQPDLTLGQLCAADLLVIDDLGTEKMTEWAAEQIITIIDTRSGNNRPTIITTNLPLVSKNKDIRTIEQLLDERSFSRLVHNIQITPVTGADLRRIERVA